MHLSKKHGLNPSISKCFFCGEDKDIILFGHLPKDAEAPMHVMTDYEPCNTCAETFKTGVLLVECAPNPLTKNQPAIQSGAYPTGSYAVIKAEAYDRIFGASAPKGGIALTEQGLLTKIGIGD